MRFFCNDICIFACRIFEWIYFLFSNRYFYYFLTMNCLTLIPMKWTKCTTWWTSNVLNFFFFNKIIKVIFTIAIARIVTLHLPMFLPQIHNYRIVISINDWIVTMNNSWNLISFYLEWWISTTDRDKRNWWNWTSKIRRECGKTKSHVKLTSKAIIQLEKIFNGCDLAWWSCHLLFLFFSHFFLHFLFLIVRASEKIQLVCIRFKSSMYTPYTRYQFLVVFFVIRNVRIILLSIQMPFWAIIICQFCRSMVTYILKSP